MRLAIEGVTVQIDGRLIVAGTDLVAEAGQFVGLVGPNGCGKSTLLRTIYRALRPGSGVVCLNGDDVWSLTARESARRTAVVAQEGHAEFDFTAMEVVLMGRTPHKRPLDRDTSEDINLATESLERVGMSHCAQRTFSTLSGGEKQRVVIARALAQRSRLFLLDEPTNHLDIRYQLEIMAMVREFGHTTLAALHDLNLAAEFCDRIYMMKDGRLVANGTPSDVLTAGRVREVFGVCAHPMIHPASGRLHLAFSQTHPTMSKATLLST